jgi:membrane-associated phospholipid phosphatase
VAATVYLAELVAHQSRAVSLDEAIDGPVQGLLGSRRTVLNPLVRIGDPIPVSVLAGILLVACVVTRRWRGALLVAVAVPGAAAVTRLLLKPFVGRTHMGGLSFPSGHATAIFALAAVFSVLLVAPPRRSIPGSLRLLLSLSSIVVAGVAATALVALQFHYATDALSGATLATAVVLMTALLLDKLAAAGRHIPGDASPAGTASAHRDDVHG